MTAAGPNPRPAPFEGVSNRDAVELLREHDGLIRYILNRWFRGRYETVLSDDDIKSVAQASLVRAWVGWRPELGSFTTIATTYVRRALWRALSLERAKTRPKGWTFPVDPSFLEDPNPSEHDLRGAVAARDRIDVPLSVESAVEADFDRERKLAWVRAQLASGLLTERRARIVELVLAGHTFSEIALRIGSCSRWWCQVEFEKAITALREEYDWSTKDDV